MIETYYQRNKERVKLKRKERRESWTIERRLWEYARDRARDEGTEFEISVEDIPKCPSHCPVSGVPLFVVGGKFTDNSPSLDRVDNSKGYIPGNVRILSRRINTRKSDLSLEEIKKLYEYTQQNGSNPTSS